MEINVRAVHFRNAEYSDPLLCPIAKAVLNSCEDSPVIVSDTNLTIGHDDFSMIGVYSYRLYKIDFSIAEQSGFDNTLIRVVTVQAYKTKRQKKGM